MNLYELQKEYNMILLQQKMIMNKIKYKRQSLEPRSVNIQTVKVEGNQPKKDIADVMHEIVELEKEFEELENKKKTIYEPILEELEKLLKEYNDIYQQIYYEYYIKGYNADKIGIRHGYSRAQVYNIINRIDEELKNKTLDKIRL